MCRTRPTKFHALGADLMMAGARYIGIAGPVDSWTAEQVRSALQMLMDAGTGTRISLRPNVYSRRWDVQSRVGEDVVRTISGATDLEQFACIVESVRRRATAAPFHVVLCGGYVLIDTAHELGDGKLFVDLVHAIGEIISTGEVPAWANIPETRHPLPAALWLWFGRSPGHLIDVIRARASLKKLGAPTPDKAAVSDASLTAWVPSHALEIARSPEASEAALGVWRKAHAPRSSAATVVITLLRRAFAEVGLNSADEVMIAVNCRRYLPAESTVNGNFVVGLSVPFAGFGSIDESGNFLDRVYKSGLPLSWLTVASSIARIFSSKIKDVPTTVSTDPRVHLMYSDLGRPRKFSDSNWFGKDDLMFTGLLDPASPDAITVMSGSVRGERTLSASFHDNVFPRDKVREALRLVTAEPIELLQRRI